MAGNALAPAAWAALQRYPVLSRIFQVGMRAELAPGIVAHVMPLVRGDSVVFPVSIAGETQTRFGPVRVTSNSEVSMPIETFGAMVTEAEARGVLPSLASFINRSEGRPLLLLPR